MTVERGQAPDRLAPLGGRAHWTGATIAAREDEWRVQLGRDDVAEILAATERFVGSGLPLSELAPDRFPLPTIAPRLREVLDELVDGRGFVLLRGFPVEDVHAVTAQVAFAGIGAHLGVAIPQNDAGDLLVHVRNEGKDFGDPTARAYETANHLDYHTDTADLVGLFCVRPARTGGVSTIVSSTAVHDEVVRRRPDLVEVLHGPWWRDRRSPTGPVAFECRTWAFHDGRFFCRFGRGHVESAAGRLPGVPALTDAQRGALDLVEGIANEPGVALDMHFRPGDMQFLNNYLVMHARTAYEDWPDPALRRHLCRLWLVVPELSLPDDFAQAGITPRSVALA